ncbi:MAG: hypothetical protein E3I25_03135 [Dehalococcoidia bacterium]|nr:MAG: hypothetical protein E3I25_03135 [Dehalococcoidia bacterium]
MKLIPSPSIYHFLVRVGIWLIVATFIVGIAGCGEGEPEGGDYYNLTIASTYGGSVTTPGESESWYAANTTVELLAETDDHHYFVNWTGDVSNIADVYAPATNITMNDHHFITANFELDQGWYYLTIDSTYGGSVTEPGEGYFAYAANTTIDLVAEPDEHCRFVNWTGNVETIADVDAAATNITIFDSYCITANFSPFAGGNGTAEDPYQIADWYQLDSVRDYLSSHFILINDLDSNSIGYTWLAGSTANGGKGWRPIGTQSYPFTGTLDGQRYKIYDLFINRPSQNYIGLFGEVGVGGIVQNIGVTSITITGYNYVGGLVGYSSGTVSNCYATGTVTGESFVGGLMGSIVYGTVTNCYATGDISAHVDVGGLAGFNDHGTVSNSYSTSSVTGNSAVGGLTGGNSGNVNNSYSTGNITSAIECAGGLVGYNRGTVSNSHSTCSVNGDYTVGGLVGWNYAGSVNNCYSTGSVNGNLGVGGLLGVNGGNAYDSAGAVSNSCSAGSVTGDYTVGGLVGWNLNGSINNCYSRGSVTGNFRVGGLLGANGQNEIDVPSTVSNSYSTGTVTGNTGHPSVGGLVGQNWEGTVSDSFWDTETSGQSTSDGGIGKTTAEMQNIATFSGAAWNIIAVADSGARNVSYTWNIVNGVTYPFLSWQS